MGHGTRSQVLINIQIQDGVPCLFEFRSVSVTLEARHKLKSIHTSLASIICLTYVLVRSISVDEEIKRVG